MEDNTIYFCEVIAFVKYEVEIKQGTPFLILSDVELLQFQTYIARNNSNKDRYNSTAVPPIPKNDIFIQFYTLRNEKGSDKDIVSKQN